MGIICHDRAHDANGRAHDNRTRAGHGRCTWSWNSSSKWKSLGLRDGTNDVAFGGMVLLCGRKMIGLRWPVENGLDERGLWHRVRRAGGCVWERTDQATFPSRT